MAGLGIGVSRWKLLHVQWESDEVLLYSTRNSIQSPVLYPDGKEYILKKPKTLKHQLFTLLSQVMNHTEVHLHQVLPLVQAMLVNSSFFEVSKIC